MSAEVVLIIRLLITIFIYVFLALTLRSLWQTTFPGQNQRKEIFSEITLTNAEKNESHTFSSPEIYIGRDENANFRIVDEAASNLHARIFLKENQWWIEDLNSTNGTLLNQEKLVAPELIASDDDIQCGETLIRITFGSGSLNNINSVTEIWR